MAILGDAARRQDGTAEGAQPLRGGAIAMTLDVDDGVADEAATDAGHDDGGEGEQPGSPGRQGRGAAGDGQVFGDLRVDGRDRRVPRCPVYER